MLSHVGHVLLLLEARPIQLTRADGAAERVLGLALELNGCSLGLLARLVI